MTVENYMEGSESEQSWHRFRIFLANLAITLGWALKRSCKRCAHKLFATARWMVPEAERFLVLQLPSHIPNRCISDFMSDLAGFLNHTWPFRVAVGFITAVALLASIDLVARASATGEPALLIQSKMASENRVSVRTTTKAARAAAAQSEAVPLPTRKPQAATRKRMAQQKSARQKIKPNTRRKGAVHQVE